jgi:DNA replication protein DnaC
MGFEFSYRHTPYLFYIPPKYHHCTLSNFDFHGDKAVAKTIKGFIEGDVKGIFFYGGFGVGKTHLLVSLYRVMVAKEDDVSDIFYTSLEAVIRELQNRMDTKESTNDYIDYLVDIDLLFLDDITAANLQNNWVVEVFRKIVNGRYENDLRTCFTSNAGPKALQELNINPHAISRIEEMCDIVKITGKDRRVRRKKEE